MQISWQGFNYFKLSNSQRSVIFNPYSLDKNIKFSKVKADVVLFTDPKTYFPVKVNEQSFVIDSPGEYEVSDIFVYGRQLNGSNIYLVSFEDVKITFLGEYGHAFLTDKDLELIEGADILILPVGGGDLTTAKEAVKIIKQIEPNIIIPMHYKLPGLTEKLDDVKDFLKEIGLNGQEAVDKLTLKKKDLINREMEVVVMKQ